MNKNQSIIVTSAFGVALLALGYIHREAIQKNARKIKTYVIKKVRRSPESAEEFPQEAACD